MGFQFTTGLVTVIETRRKSAMEIYAELGGIYAASIAILAFVFVKRY
jgi:hypothetical protein